MRGIQWGRIPKLCWKYPRPFNRKIGIPKIDFPSLLREYEYVFHKFIALKVNTGTKDALQKWIDFQFECDFTKARNFSSENVLVFTRCRFDHCQSYNMQHNYVTYKKFRVYHCYTRNFWNPLWRGRGWRNANLQLRGFVAKKVNFISDSLKFIEFCVNGFKLYNKTSVFL